MGNRLSKIATRTGDDGSTGLGDGSRTGKDSARIAALGDVDELNSFVGLLLCEDMPGDLREELVTIQHDLFDLGGELCIPGYQLIKDEQVARLDALLEKYNADLPVLKEFILPAGGEAAARCHLARTIVRRAERETVTLARRETVRPEALHYLNRLSDLLFVLARVLARADGHGEVLWRHERRHA
jgi:cob(I)alamin adenosyltransferase